MSMRRYNKRSKRLRKKYRGSISAMLYYNELGRSLRGKAEYYICDGIQMGLVKYDNVELEFFENIDDANRRGELCFRDKNLNFYPNSFMRDNSKSDDKFYKFLKATGVLMGVRGNKF
ncbi:hypothetical protein I9Y31_001422 [Clostridium perfringens]|nr:hypothetical protein [Clostridium perfringens]